MKPLIAYPSQPQDKASYLKVFTAYINSQIPLKEFIRQLPEKHRKDPALPMRLKWDLRARISSLPKPPQSLLNTHTNMHKQYILPVNITDTSIIASHPEYETLTPIQKTEMVVNWRNQQAAKDYESADKLRAVLNQAIEHYDHCVDLPADDPVFDTSYANAFKFDIKDIRQIAAALVDIQRIQRMALGLSTDNVGFKLDGVDASGATLPIVNVMMQRQFKALHPAPVPQDEDTQSEDNDNISGDVLDVAATGS